MKIRYTPRAFAERKAIFDYLNDRNPKAAHDIVGLIARRIVGLADEPQKGHKTDRRGIGSSIELTGMKSSSFTFGTHRGGPGGQQRNKGIRFGHRSPRPFKKEMSLNVPQGDALRYPFLHFLGQPGDPAFAELDPLGKAPACSSCWIWTKL